MHGAGSGPWIFDGWAEAFPDVRKEAIDLQAGLEVPRARMEDYATAVNRAAENLPRPLLLCGWSMGGLVCLMAASSTDALVLLEPSPPAEVQSLDATIEPMTGAFDPEEAYGQFPPRVLKRPESALARAERKRGISVPAISCPTLVVYGDESPEERGSRIADFYRADALHFPGLSHWDLILDPVVRSAIRAWWRSLAKS